MKLLKLNKTVVAIAFGMSLIAVPAISSSSSEKYQCKEVSGVYGVYSRVSKGYMNLSH